jgi:hypothetical protein
MLPADRMTPIYPILPQAAQPLDETADSQFERDLQRSLKTADAVKVRITSVLPCNVLRIEKVKARHWADFRGFYLAWEVLTHR